jgi:hypothetical protein
MTQKKLKAEYGDFQTPSNLAQSVCALVAENGFSPVSLLEPTCGLGRFLFAGLDQFKGIKKCLGYDINPAYINETNATLHNRQDSNKVEIIQANFFETDWFHIVEELPEPILVTGNLPWVTNAHLCALGSENLPQKSNFQRYNGFDAITGKANFDISEWMLIRLFEAMNGRKGVLAILCKSSVARKVLCHGWKNSLSFDNSGIFRIDADLHFKAAVDAVLLVTHFQPNASNLTAKVYPRLKKENLETIIGYEDETLLADIDAFHSWRHLCGDEVMKWRSGIKHDCSKVMELHRHGDKYLNGLGEIVDVEDEYLFPLLKSSDLSKGGGNVNRCMIVTQKKVAENTAGIEEIAPKTWNYLKSHKNLLNKRGSSIYHNRPAFSIFGVGDYSFTPWKVAISGFYKKLEFVLVGPVKSKPVVLDDTSYFLPCQTQEQAEYIGTLLNSPVARSFYKAFIFWDSKRPITADILRRMDLRLLAKELGSEQVFNVIFGEEEEKCSGDDVSLQLEFWI